MHQHKCSKWLLPVTAIEPPSRRVALVVDDCVKRMPHTTWHTYWYGFICHFAHPTLQLDGILWEIYWQIGQWSLENMTMRRSIGVHFVQSGKRQSSATNTYKYTKLLFHLPFFFIPRWSCQLFFFYSIVIFENEWISGIPTWNHINGSNGSKFYPQQQEKYTEILCGRYHYFPVVFLSFVPFLFVLSAFLYFGFLYTSIVVFQHANTSTNNSNKGRIKDIRRPYITSAESKAKR